MIVGIYGKSGSGKSSVGEYLSKKKNFHIIDCDKISHKILLKGNLGYEKVIENFGRSFLCENMEIDRKKLGIFVFSNEEKLKLLNEITFPVIEDEVKKNILENNDKNILIDGAHLYKTNIVSYCDFTILIKSDKSLERIMKRDNISEENALNRLNSQDDYNIADYVINNNDTLDKLYEKIDEIIEKRGF